MGGTERPLPAPAPHRARRRLLLAAALPAALAGCGFKLRGVTQLPFETFYSSAAQSSPLGGELRRAVRINGATVVDRREDAQVRFDLPDVAHTFLPGHKIMVQVQSTWFPLADRNPQQFVDVYHAKDSDFIPAEIQVFHTPLGASSVVLPVLRK